MKIKFDWKIILFVLFFCALRVEKIYLLFLIFTIIHEIFHMIFGIIVGFQPSQMTIMPIGAYISFKIDMKNYNKKILRGTYCSMKKILVAIAGPLANVIMAILFFMKKNSEIIVNINLIIALFNLIPIFPLDGGRIIKHILIILYGRRKALKYTNIISNTMLCIITLIIITLCVINKSFFVLLTLAYLIYIRKKENDVYKMKERVYKILEK